MNTEQELHYLTPYQHRVEETIKSVISTFGMNTGLKEACEYALLNGGKRLRPAIALMISDALGKRADVSEAALAVEFFHTASLVADDLPSMDDDELRRGKPSVHKVYGESLALLVSYTLIASGYELIAKNAKSLERAGVPHSNRADNISTCVLENAGFNTGIFGATGGQFLDIYPPDLSLPTLREIIHKKTVSLYEISFVSGWLFGGGSVDQLDVVKKIASHFGMAFQIVDDLGDMEQDIKNNRKINMANVFGRESAEKMFHVEHDQYLLELKELGIDSQELCMLMKELAQKF